MSTIKDVAKLAGVSVATVSNYVNHTRPVSVENSKKIRMAIEETQYTQNLSAKSLKSSNYCDIGVILPNFDDSYYVHVFQGIESAFQNSGYYLNLSFTYDIPSLEQDIVNKFLRKKICGLILVSCQPKTWKFYHDAFSADHVPIVLIDRDIKGLDANLVSFNYANVINEVTIQLLKKKITNIALVTGFPEFTCEASCISGFRKAYEEYALVCPESSILVTNYSKEDAFRKTIQLLNHNKTKAVIATSEAIATGVTEAMNFLGYTLKDIPVVSLGEEHWNSFTHSHASETIPRPAMKIGRNASTLLLEQLHSPLTKETERIAIQNPAAETALFTKTTEFYPAKAKDKSAKEINILLLDTPQVNSLVSMIHNFENKTHTKANITIASHHSIYGKIIANSKEDEAKYDVVMYDIPWLLTLASEHILADISEELKSIDLNIFLPNILKYFSRYENRFYGIPFMYAPQIFYYRKELFENTKLRNEYEKMNSLSLRPPATLKEYNTIANFFTEKTDAIHYGISIPAAYDECLAPELYMRLRAYDCEITSDSKGKIQLDSENALKAYINFLRSVKYSKPDYRSATDVSVVKDFLNGETAMLITYPSFLADIVDLQKNTITGSIGYHYIPGKSSLLGGWSLGITNNSKCKSEAFEFLKWTCDKQFCNYITLLGGRQLSVQHIQTMNSISSIHGFHFTILPIHIQSLYYHPGRQLAALSHNRKLMQSYVNGSINY